MNTNRNITLAPFLSPLIQAHPEVASDHVDSLESSKKTSPEGQKPYKDTAVLGIPPQDRSGHGV